MTSASDVMFLPFSVCLFAGKRKSCRLDEIFGGVGCVTRNKQWIFVISDHYAERIQEFCGIFTIARYGNRKNFVGSAALAEVCISECF